MPPVCRRHCRNMGNGFSAAGTLRQYGSGGAGTSIAALIILLSMRADLHPHDTPTRESRVKMQFGSQRIAYQNVRFPIADSASSVARIAVRLTWSRIGLTSTKSRLTILPFSATSSIAICASR